MSEPAAFPAVYEYSTPGSTWDGSDVVFARVFRALEGLPPGARVLDAGCGNGYLTGLLADRGFLCHGVDPSNSGIDVARRAYPAASFACLDLTREPLDPCSFDAAACMEVIEHVYAPRQLLAGLLEALKPGGRLVLSTPYHGYLKNLAVLAGGRFDRHFNPLWDHGHIKFFSKHTLGTALREAGFIDISIRGLGRVPGLWKTMVATARRPENHSRV